LQRVHHNLTPEEAHALRVPSLDAFLDYSREVWARTDEYLARVTDGDLQHLVKVPPMGEIPVMQLLGQAVIAHGRQHLGHIDLTRAFQGLSSLDVARV
jgi:hypothetical protein